mgnify:FL=1
MFSFFKRDNVQKELDDNTNSFQEVISVICIMLEISRLDGKIDASEIEEIKKYFDENFEDANFEETLAELQQKSSEETSFHPYVESINSNCMKEEKIEIMKIIWKLILSDGVIDPYEDNLFMQIGDLLFLSLIHI